MADEKGETPILHGLCMREYRKEDLAACSRLAWEAWVAPDEPMDEGLPSPMEGYVRSFLMRSNWNYVVEDSGKIVALLFGRIGRGGGKNGALLNELGMIPHFLFGDDPQHLPPVVVYHFFMTEFKVFVNVPRSDAEVNLVMVSRKLQRKGLGRQLMDRFVEAAERAGCKLMTLYTDNQMSNWRFYEIYGFRKVATFHDNLTSYFSETRADGIVYALDLK